MEVVETQFHKPMPCQNESSGMVHEKGRSETPVHSESKAVLKEQVYDCFLRGSRR